MPAIHLAYLGPEGSFTFLAAQKWIEEQALNDVQLTHRGSADDVFAAVSDGTADLGIVAFENNVEGYVASNVDHLILGEHAVAVSEVVLSIKFDAVSPSAGSFEPGAKILGHPHALAQCHSFIATNGLIATPTPSNSAACEEVKPGQLALCPQGQAATFNLQVVHEDVNDFQGATTQFFVIAHRDRARELVELFAKSSVAIPFRSIFAFIPASTGSGVLSRVLNMVKEQGLNLTNIITRPIKTEHNKYAFAMTLDDAPWEESVRELVRQLIDQGDWVKLIGAYAVRGQTSSRIDEVELPPTGATSTSSKDDVERALLWTA